MIEADFRAMLPGPQSGGGPESDGAEAIRPWNWRALDPVACEFAFDELVGWVDWLVGRYDIADQLPACWANHGWAVEELSALYFSWLSAYEDPESRAEAALDWHESFERARERVRDWDRYGCTAGTHRSGPSHLDALRRAGRMGSPAPGSQA